MSVAKKTAGRKKHSMSGEQRDLLYRVATRFVSYEDMAYIVGCSVSTLRKHYVEIIDEARAKTRASVLSKQVEKALAGDNTMLIWVGKNHCGQSDKLDTRNDNYNTEIKVVDVD